LRYLSKKEKITLAPAATVLKRTQKVNEALEFQRQLM
jgi:hypothetical protein